MRGSKSQTRLKFFVDISLLRVLAGRGKNFIQMLSLGTQVSEACGKLLEAGQCRRDWGMSLPGGDDTSHSTMSSKLRFRLLSLEAQCSHPLTRLKDRTMILICLKDLLCILWTQSLHRRQIDKADARIRTQRYCIVVQIPDGSLPHIYRSLWRGCSTNWRVPVGSNDIIEPLIIGIAGHSYTSHGHVSTQRQHCYCSRSPPEGCLRDGNSDQRITGWTARHTARSAPRRPVCEAIRASLGGSRLRKWEIFSTQCELAT